ncbi:hypothetical protein ADIARSV_2011 [Arcticibacter svalbardensis MN12-7]|uniref:Uncharacterized protein n=1 Tax=Arcticibacter svalbardensis MN12-7 TaxID=1150600 RepID=R9GTC7_9SPHI|nr:hypothetical protein [Arcticibacter svalbardensis]EOR94795.1 hypothetical protein ADIARSV_2011 [Arcticibacter svalbardensis MN12-7]
MKSKNYFGLCGSFLVISGALSPLIHIPVIGNWNYLDLHTGLATVVLIIAAIGVFASLSGRSGLLKFLGWAELVLVLLTLSAVYFKVNDSFSFIPLKSLTRVAVGLVHYKWLGWALLALGSVVMIASGSSGKKKI